MESVLVTGGAGFIGSHVARVLVDQGFAVTVLDDLSGGFRENIPRGADLIVGSVTDEALVARVFAGCKPKYVYHLAAYAAEGLSHFIRRFNYLHNLIGTVNLLNEAVRHESHRFVFTSSIAVYGEIDPPMREDVTPRPEDPYGIAKLAAEQDLAAAFRMFGQEYAILRPHNVYGEHQHLGDPYRNVVGIFMNQIMTGAPLTIFGDGSQQRAFSYIGDVAPLIVESAWLPAARNQIVNVGADEPYTVNDLAVAVAVAMGVPGHAIRHLEARIEAHSAFADHTRQRAIFGDRRGTSLPDGLRAMADWARVAGVRTTQPFAAIEIERNLPASWARLGKA